MSQAERTEQPVVIIGGGFTGAAVAWHLAHRRPADSAPVVIVEPRAVLGAGLAYSAAERCHRTNVPARRMCLSTADRGAFQRWLEARPEQDADEIVAGARFPSRALFGAFVAAQLQPLLAAGRVRHVRQRAGAAVPDGCGFRIVLEDGTALQAGALVLATSHPAPAVPAALAPLHGAPGFFACATDPGLADAIGRDDRVLIVGSGLTMADVVAALDARGHRAPVTALSRRGLRSREQATACLEPFGDFTARPVHRASALVRTVRATVREAAAAGVPWQAVLDRVRNDGQAIWQALSPQARLRVARHLRVFWDVHRFRIAPQVAGVLERRAGEGLFDLRAGYLAGAAAQAGGLTVRWRPRGTQALQQGCFDAVVVATGPAHGDIVCRNPVVASLAGAGLVGLDPTGLGLATTRTARAVGCDGQVCENLFIAGPLARGTFGELMGLPEVTAHAELVAAELAARLAGHQAAA